MKTILPLLAILFSLTAFADEGDIVKETWTCANGEIKVSAVLTPKKAVARIASEYAGEETELELSKGSLPLNDGLRVELHGSIGGHDTFDYTATLMRTDEEFESWGGQKHTVAKGKLSLITEMFIDCVGNRIDAEVLECKVVIERE